MHAISVRQSLDINAMALLTEEANVILEQDEGQEEAVDPTNDLTAPIMTHL